jgi:predicted transcriptional regulator
MSIKSLLLSIHPKYAALIFEGSKTVELRRVRPTVKKGDLIFVYASSPIKAIKGVLRVRDVTALALDDLWQVVENSAGVTLTEFEHYFEGKDIGYGIWVEPIESYQAPISLEMIRRRWLNFRPPQSYMYLSEDKARLLHPNPTLLFARV